MAVADNAGIGMAMNMVPMSRSYPLISLEAAESAADQLYEQQQMHQQQQQQQAQHQVQQQQLQQQQQNQGPQNQSNPLQKQVASGQGQEQEQEQVAKANGSGNGHVKGENEGEGEEEGATVDARSIVSNDSMRELEDLLTKLNPLAKEFVPPSLADASTTASSAASSKAQQPRKVGLHFLHLICWGMHLGYCGCCELWCPDRDRPDLVPSETGRWGQLKDHLLVRFWWRQCIIFRDVC